MASPLYRRHSAGLAATYADLENHALSQGAALIGTPGSVSLRFNPDGAKFYVRQYYDYDRTKRDQYIAAEGSPGAEQRVAELRQRIAEANDALTSVRLLSREGYAIFTPRHVAAIAPVSKYGLFAAGAVLVGSHALGVIVNRLGIRVAAFPTEDVDIARPSRLALAGVPEGGLLEILRESGIDFVKVPPLNPRDPSTKFKERGRSRFTFDVLVPASGDEAQIVPVPELKIHATGLPYLRYLLGETQTGAALSNHGIIAVRVPVAERFALHKLVVSQLRRGGSEKALKDQRQAAALIAALGELQPGALEAAYRSTPLSVRKHIRKSFEGIRESLAAHSQSLDEMERLVAR